MARRFIGSGISVEHIAHCSKMSLLNHASWAGESVAKGLWSGGRDGRLLSRRECQRSKGNGSPVRKGRWRVVWVSWHDSPCAVGGNGSKTGRGGEAPALARKRSFRVRCPRLGLRGSGQRRAAAAGRVGRKAAGKGGRRGALKATGGFVIRMYAAG